MNFIKNFKAKSPKAFWAIIVVIVALVVVGFANNNNNGSPFSFSKTPQKFIESKGTDQIWKISYVDQNQYIKLGDDSKVYGGDDKDSISTSSDAEYKFNSNNDLDVKGTGSSSAFSMDLKDLKVENNKIKGNATMSYDGKSINTDVTLTPAD